MTTTIQIQTVKTEDSHRLTWKSFMSKTWKSITSVETLIHWTRASPTVKTFLTAADININISTIKLLVNLLNKRVPRTLFLLVCLVSHIVQVFEQCKCLLVSNHTFVSTFHLIQEYNIYVSFSALLKTGRDHHSVE